MKHRHDDSSLFRDAPPSIYEDELARSGFDVSRDVPLAPETIERLLATVRLRSGTIGMKEVAGPPRTPDWGALYAQYRSMLIAETAMRMPPSLRQRGDPEDLLQEALLSAFPKFEARLDESDETVRQKFLGLVMDEVSKRIAAREDIRHTRKRGSEAVDTPSQIIERAAMEYAIVKAMDRLSEEDRRLILMREIEQKNWKEIGDIHGCSPREAREQFNQAFRRLMNLMP